MPNSRRSILATRKHPERDGFNLTRRDMGA
jgi:hypothetical protein